jgi:peptide methionine sulfoxide reductase MsrA
LGAASATGISIRFLANIGFAPSEGFDAKLYAREAVIVAPHDPTQGFRQGNDIGTQYRSAIYTTTSNQLAAAEASRDAYAGAIAGKGYGPITTEIRQASPVYLAEDYHQQYLAKVPHGYCGLSGTGVACPMPRGGDMAP